MVCHGQMKSSDENTSKRVWRKDMKIVKHYKQYRQSFVKMLGEFYIVWDDHLKWINVVKQRIKPELSNQRPIHS